MRIQVVLQIIICQFQLIPDIDGVLGLSKQLFNAELDILKTEIGALAFEMVKSPLPEIVLSNGVLLDDGICVSEQSLLLTDIRLHN